VKIEDTDVLGQSEDRKLNQAKTKPDPIILCKLKFR